MYSALSTPTTCASSGSATLVSTTDAEAPGNTPVTVTCGGTISGNCATGMCVAASAPAMEMTNAMTIARRGRSTKTAEIMGFCPPAGRHRRAFGCDRHRRPPSCWIRSAYSLAPTHALQCFGDHLVAQLKPVDDGGNCRGGLPELYAAFFFLVYGDHREDV